MRMKFFLVLLFVGCASASFYDVLDSTVNRAVLDFMVGMENVPSLKSAVGFGYADQLDEVEEDIKTELGKTLKESLDNIVEKIKDAIDNGKKVSQDLLDKAAEITDQLKNLGIDAGVKTLELLNKLKDKAKELLKNLLDKLGIGKRSLRDLMDMLKEKLNLRNLIETMKEKLLSKLDLHKISEYIKNKFGNLKEFGLKILEAIKTKGLEALKDLLRKILPSYNPSNSVKSEVCSLLQMLMNNLPLDQIITFIRNKFSKDWQKTLMEALTRGGVEALKVVVRDFCTSAPSHSIIDLWQKIKDFFKDLGLQIQEKFSKFAEWVKTIWNSGLENAKDKLAMVKIIAQEFINNAKDVSAEVAREALEFFRPYKDDLGTLWDELYEKAKGIMG
ncbi:uncharacterized protein LOC111085107 isoform X1 [Limulus polyphemus]|uniref:Uncharacterized protein LOC111085107 isoform X1 n=2 Tax=Limulus polyphemus TaxID=6850 RepID=A0ABM1S303_LIMPO|nr:uncharacterized protein LOC111085107 isoform X1 [Limulus polyphemus]